MIDGQTSRRLNYPVSNIQVKSELKSSIIIIISRKTFTVIQRPLPSLSLLRNLASNTFKFLLQNTTKFLSLTSSKKSIKLIGKIPKITLHYHPTSELTLNSLMIPCNLNLFRSQIQLQTFRSIKFA